ncbi:hypothetical protein KR51_00012260 [Rubidibacter lacunae KORDI 51-2]|uniref:Uncharacterized protein n=1 Tax=Rubidibacter lacunae KORDI 51-2 TaxID=582515 RepID=U5DR31_9CHRO|nr:hypothetical protein KR51_00012260 [Rubidibacter lacunae KORDI 51-2]
MRQQKNTKIQQYNLTFPGIQIAFCLFEILISGI